MTFLNFYDVIAVAVDQSNSRLTNYIQHEYGLLRTSFDTRSPDLQVRWLPDSEASRPIQRVVRPPIGISENGVCFFDTKGHRFELNLEQFGCEDYTVWVDPEFNAHFFAIAIEYLVAYLLSLRSHYLCHASCVKINGEVLLFPAWRHTGKTNLLLELLADGAEYVADDWVIVSEQGEVLGLPKRLNLLHYNFVAHPKLLDRLPQSFQSLHSFVRRAEDGEFDLNTEVLDQLREQARMRISIHELFDRPALTSREVVDRVVVLVNTADSNSGIRISDATAHDSAAALAGILNFEQQYFLTAIDAHQGLLCQGNSQLTKAKESMSQCIARSMQKINRHQRLDIADQNNLHLALPWLLS